MCGICGFVVNNKIGCSDWNGLLRKMTEVLAHRGPDSEGVYYQSLSHPVIGLGHRRLSIIDLSKNANQPMSNEDKSLFVVFNGEIYNYKNLAKELETQGHKFRSNSDTEVILHLYEELGEECLQKLEGMFSFAVWDNNRKKIFLARDRMGIKPLFYAFIKDNFYFASEIKSLLFVPEISREIDIKALDCFFTYGYIPESRTIFQDIKKLPAASFLIFENKEIDIKSYWSIQYLPKHNFSESELIEGLIDIFTQAVEKHLVSDVPLGAFLSGGVDSSIIVALMNKIGGKTVDTFSLGYESGGKDELNYAAIVAKHYGTNHHEFRVNPKMIQVLPELLWHLDEPFFDNSIIPTYYISKYARENVKVVLSGDGGDEIFGGYEWTRRYQYSYYYQKTPVFIRNRLGKPTMDDKFVDDYASDYISKAKRFLKDLNSDMEKGFARRTSVSLNFRHNLYTEELKNNLKSYDALDIQKKNFFNNNVLDPREKMLQVDTMMYLPDDCLFKVDRMSMAHGLEVRVPFLDMELVDYVARIPFKYKIRGFTSKYILKKAFASYLPKKIFKQRKQGFSIPVSAWLRESKLGLLADRILLGESLRKRGLFDQKRIKWMLDQHRCGKQELGHRIWSLVVFEVWAKLYLDEKINTAPGFSIDDFAK